MRIPRIPLLHFLLPFLVVFAGDPSNARAQSCSVLSLDDPVQIYGSDAGNVYFFSKSNKLFRIQGTSVVLLRDFGQIVNFAMSPGFQSYWNGSQELVLFAANTPGIGQELWATDGTPAGTRLVMDTLPGPFGGEPGNLTVMNGMAFFCSGSRVGRELWVTDGTTVGTRIVKDIAPIGSSDPGELLPFKGRLYFSATDGSVGGAGRELWVSDGTAAGTVMLVDLLPGPLASRPTDLARCGDGFVFQAVGTVNGNPRGFELHISDGTAAGTRLLKDIFPGPGNSFPRELTTHGVHGDEVYFVATDPAAGEELFRTDGTSAGTVMIKDIEPGPGSSGILNLSSAGDRLFFSANAQGLGPEAYVTDGTAAGTVVLGNLSTFSVTPTGPFVAAGGGVFGRIGSDLYFSDGTPAGTQIYCRRASGRPIVPLGLTVAGGAVYFSGAAVTTRALVRLDGDIGTIETVAGSCGVETTTLSSEDPRIGQPITISGSDRAGGPGLLMIGAMAVAQPLPGLLAPHCLLRLDAATIVWRPQPSTPRWSINTSVPNDPSLVGGVVGLQSVYGAQPFRTSRALRAVIGQ